MSIMQFNMEHDSPILHDINMNPLQTIQDYQLPTDLARIDMSNDFDLSHSNLPLLAEGILASTDMNDFLTNNSFDDVLSDMPALPPPEQYENVLTPSQSPSIDEKHPLDKCLTFLNAPEQYYHVRYLSEITSGPVQNNIVKVKNKTKRNISGRYLKGVRGRYITISLPANLTHSSTLYIRVTRLTLPYKGIDYIHPYPLLYSDKKTKDVLIDHFSIYYKLTKEDLYNQTKQFANMILTRRKQGELNQLSCLYSFGGRPALCLFEGDTPKQKIFNYQLKKSILDFSLVVYDEQNNEFVDTGEYCRSEELTEAEGTEWKKLREIFF